MVDDKSGFAFLQYNRSGATEGQLIAKLRTTRY